MAPSMSTFHPRTPADILRLQQLVSNKAVQRLLMRQHHPGQPQTPTTQVVARQATGSLIQREIDRHALQNHFYSEQKLPARMDYINADRTNEAKRARTY